MANTFLRFEDGKIRLNGKDLLVQSANLSISPSLQPSRVYGDYDETIRGAATEFINFTPSQGLRGQLNVSFYISADIISVNSIDRLFELAEIGSPSFAKKRMSEEPINGNVVGRYSFDNMYLKSFGFDMSPFGLIRANATYDIYGTINKVINTYFQKEETNFAHSLKSFGQIKISNTDSSDEIEVTSLKYNINVERKTSTLIRKNENTAINTYAGGAVPSRVSAEKIESDVSIECNEMAENINAYGDRQLAGFSNDIPNTEIDVFMYTLGGDRIGKFSCSGKIHSQSMSISEGSSAKSSINIKEIIL